MRAIGAVLTVIAVMPIWFYLLYKILVAVNATDLMWFLYIAYLPASIVAAVINIAIREGK